MAIDELRVRSVNRAPIRGDRDYVVYWMIANRRVRSNFALQRAVERAVELGKPLVVFEPLRCDYPWASDRLHSFILDGMLDNAAALEATPVTYFPYVEPVAGAGRGLLEALAARATLLVTDEFPCFFLPHMVAAAARRLDVRLEQVDANGLMPLRAADRVFSTAFSYRCFIQKELPRYLGDAPKVNPLARVRLPRLAKLPAAITSRWKPARLAAHRGHARLLAQLPLDHAVAVTGQAGGSQAARQLLKNFIYSELCRYDGDRNHPDRKATSGLSPYLHFGHVGTHEVFAAVARQEAWDRTRLANSTNGKREGWWRMSAAAEAFLDQLVTWRELGFHFSLREPAYDRYESLPDWAQRTLRKHARDRRDRTYRLAQFESAATHDSLWNAAQTELICSGSMHNAMRMLWGKKVLEWTESPKEALEVLIHLNNKYALDGRDPNSYSGIFWCLGRFDRAWGPERPVFGTVRYMSSTSAARKWQLKDYLARWSV